MKKIFTILSLLVSVALFAQNGDAVVSALKEGSADKFANYFGNAVDIKFPQKDEIKNLTKADAASAVSNFFSSNGINGFEVTSQREMGGTMYIAGKLKGTSKSFNLTVMLKNGAIITIRLN